LLIFGWNLIKTTMRLAFILLALCIFQNGFVSGQNSTDTTDYVAEKIFVITKNDGTEYIGKILSQDEREVLIETKELGRIVIPKHEIRSITEVKEGELDRSGKYIAEEPFPTRHFITTNGIPLKQGESYMLWNWYGPDFQIGLSDKFSLGFMTTWVASPLAITAKYSMRLGEKVNLGLGAILGTFSWLQADQALMVPFSSLTVGTRRSNISLSTGYGAFFSGGDVGGRLVFSVGAMTALNSKISFVFDSIILPSISVSSDGFMLLLPGFRWHTGIDKAFQFGFGVLAFDDEVVSLPIPMVQWYRKF
jgi:hypothetical protein